MKVDGRGAPVITQEKRENLFLDLELGSSTLQELGDKYGVTRERIRQLQEKWHVNKGNRRARRKVKTLVAKIRDEKFSETYNLVWREAVKQGFTVKAWAAANGTLHNRALFINGRRVWLSRSRTSQVPTPDSKQRYYHFGALESGTRIVVADESPNLRFYILLDFKTRPDRSYYYIPVEKAKYRSTKNKYFDSFNAWHLLSSHNENSNQVNNSISPEATR